MFRSITILVIALAGLAGNARAADLAVVVNKTCGLDGVGAAELTKYFKAEKSKTPDGTKLVIVVQDVGRPERAAALKGIYKMSESEYSEYFVEATFTGAVAAAPKALPTGAAVKKFVAETPGGIGYIRDSDVDDTVKVVKIDGKSPGAADYPLKTN
ncbi:MAG TPA: hypothetical protein VG710_05300 [Opitutus sp.]|nr:hypothetical protein [Opitutus sp.]